MSNKIFLSSKKDRQSIVIEENKQFVIEYLRKNVVVFTNVILKGTDAHLQREKAIAMAKEYTYDRPNA